MKANFRLRLPLTIFEIKFHGKVYVAENISPKSEPESHRAGR